MSRHAVYCYYFQNKELVRLTVLNLLLLYNSLSPDIDIMLAKLRIL